MACAEFGTYTATGLVVMAATSGVDTKIEFDISTALIWFICGQLGTKKGVVCVCVWFRMLAIAPFEYAQHCWPGAPPYRTV